MGNTSFTFRNYVPADLITCMNLAGEAWPLPPEIAVGVRMDGMIKNWIESEVAGSTYAEVAESEAGVIGLLFGKVKGQPVLEQQRGLVRSEVNFLLRVLSGSYGNVMRSLRLMISFQATDLKLLINDPRADAKIEMLIVDEAYRGKGLGKLLVTRFIETAKKQGGKSLSVYTDDQTSNWRFYEMVGFKRIAEFHDNGSSRYVGKHANALIYRLDI
jgi:ribosomal protein S18 acetylase RimI-like enzyme